MKVGGKRLEAKRQVKVDGKRPMNSYWPQAFRLKPQAAGKAKVERGEVGGWKWRLEVGR